MEFTEDEKQIASKLFENKPAIELLEKIFVDKEDRIDPQLALLKTNEELGEIIRADLLASQKIKDRFARLRNLAVQGKSKKSAKVPS